MKTGNILFILTTILSLPVDNGEISEAAPVGDINQSCSRSGQTDPRPACEMFYFFLFGYLRSAVPCRPGLVQSSYRKQHDFRYENQQPNSN